MAIPLKSKLEKEFLLKVSRMKPVIKPTVPHRHAGYHELIFLSKGSGTHTIGDERFEVLPNTGYYLGLSEVHCWDFSKIPDGYVILFKEEVLANYPKAFNILFQLEKTFDLGTNSEQLFSLLDLFHKGFQTGTSQEQLAAYLNLLILNTYEIPVKNIPIDSGLTDQLSQFKRLINQHFRDFKNVGDYAALMNVSARKLNTICRIRMNSSARDLIKERVLIEAKNSLAHTGRQVAEIAYELNFTDSSNFVKFFKQHTNLTPLEYRSKLR